MTLALSALFAGIVAVLVTVSIERLGGIRGGIIGTLPSTIVPAAYGLFEVSTSADAFQVALSATPAGMILNALFLLAWRELPARLPTSASRLARFALTLVVTLLLWALLAFALSTVLRNHVIGRAPPLVVACASTSALFALGLFAMRGQPKAVASVRHVPLLVLVVRGLLAAAAVYAALLLAKAGAPVVAGLAAVFPAIFLTTMMSLWLSHGEDLPRAAAGPMMLGSTSVASYAVFALLLFPHVGPGIGTLVAWALSAVCVTWPIARRVRR